MSYASQSNTDPFLNYISLKTIGWMMKQSTQTNTIGYLYFQVLDPSDIILRTVTTHNTDDTFLIQSYEALYPLEGF